MVKAILAFILGVTVSACMADKLFPFHYYALDAMTYNGDLRGPTADQDLALKMCMPTDTDKAPCMVMFTSAFLRLKQAHIQAQLDLAEAQRNCP